MAGKPQAKQPTREKKINGTTYIVTTHFKEQGCTVTEHIRRMIDSETKERKIRRIF